MELNTELGSQQYEKLRQLQRTVGKDLRSVLELPLMNCTHAVRLLSVRMLWQSCARTEWSVACMMRVIFRKNIRRHWIGAAR
jgi:hypothetical protein